jgi:DNA-directed RNA polymerase specialized sigma54-like protein
MLVSLIKNLNPKPGLIFQKSDRTSYIAADVFVKKDDGQWITTLNEDNHIKLKLEENAHDLLS